LLVIPESRSDIRDRCSFWIGLPIQMNGKPIDSRHPWRSRCASPSAFAFAILQTQSGSAAKSRGGPGM